MEGLTKNTVRRDVLMLHCEYYFNSSMLESSTVILYFLSVLNGSTLHIYYTPLTLQDSKLKGMTTSKSSLETAFSKTDPGE